MSLNSSFESAGVFDAIMNFFTQISLNGITSMIPYASYLIFIFGVIDLCTSWYLYDGQLKYSIMISKIMKIGAFYVLVVHWKDIAGAIGHSFSYIGYIAGGHTASEAATITNTNAADINSVFSPSKLIDMGNSASSKIMEAYSKSDGFSFGKIIICGICWLLVILGFYFIALQLILTNIEFAIFTCLAIILLPFGCLKYTSFLSQKAISGVFSFGIKMMVMYFLLGILQTLGDSFGASVALQDPNSREKQPDVNYSYMLKQALAYITVGYLVWKLPTLVSGMMQGSPSSMGSEFTPTSPISAVARGTAATAGVVMAGIANTKAASQTDDGSSSGGSGSSAGSAAGAADKATATDSSSSRGMFSKAAAAIKGTPGIGKQATQQKIAQYKSQMAGKDLKGKAALAGKIAGLTLARGTVKAGIITGAMGRAVWGQTSIYGSYRNAQYNGTWKSDENKKDKQKSDNDKKMMEEQQQP